MAEPLLTLLTALVGEMSGEELQDALCLLHGEHFRVGWLAPALRDGLIELAFADKLRSSK